MKTNRQVEILAPAGSRESLEAAICAGADAVYLGGTRFGARAYAKNLDEEQMLDAIDYVHLHGRKIYMTVNTLLKNQEMEELYDYLLPYYKQGLDAVIVQDVGAMQFIRDRFPDMALHVSTQATVTNTLGAGFFKKIGAERIVPAREISLDEVRRMKQDTGLEMECFVHGAMCYCYSGQCLMSSMIGGRSGNRGQCAQPCRLPYSVGGYKAADIMSLKDLCTIELIPELVEAGIDSFKIEGRMKQPDYVYTVTQMYRKYTDLYLKKGKSGFKVSREDLRKLQESYRRRGYTDGYYQKQNGKDMISLKRPPVEKEIEKVKREYKTQEKINGKLILSEGECARLSLEVNHCGTRIQAEAVGAEVQKAKNQPLDRERIDKQMRKMGNTEFTLQELAIEIEGNIFLPMQALNELRRQTLAELEKAILAIYHREVPEEGKKIPDIALESSLYQSAEGAFDNIEGEASDNLILQLYVSTTEQLKCALDSRDVDLIYVDDGIAFREDVLALVQARRIDGTTTKIYAVMPYVFRERAVCIYEKQYDKIVDYYDGVLIRNWESLEWLTRHHYEKPIYSDYNMYVFNNKSKEFLGKSGIAEYTIQPELNYQELRKMAPGGILIAYGYQPVMITANCIQQTTDRCTGKEGLLTITDRMGKKFRVKNICRYCYNVIYNTAPLLLLDQKKEIKTLHPSALRLDFVTETRAQMKQVVENYRRVFLEESAVSEEMDMPEEFTRGHFKRGVK